MGTAGGSRRVKCRCDAGTESDLRKWPRIGQPPGFARQCRGCGSRGAWIDVLDVISDGVDPGSVPMAKLSRGSTGLGGDGNSKRREYRKFLRSAAWRRQRERVLARDRYRCADCGAPATCAAHIRYADPIERTPDRDVKASCDECNQAERESRIASAVLGG